jgi:hypothetical protein
MGLHFDAFSAVLPVQDYIKSAFWLECIRVSKVVCLAAALAFTIFLDLDEESHAELGHRE